MGSNDADRKRRHFSSVSPTAVSNKKQTFAFFSEDKKLNAAVLQYQNQKLEQRVEVRKVERGALENKFSKLKKKQLTHDATLEVINRSWQEVVNDLESCSVSERESSCKTDGKCSLEISDGPSSSPEHDFLSRLTESGATQSSVGANCSIDISNDTGEDTGNKKMKSILSNIVAAINDMWYLKDHLHAQVLKELLAHGSGRGMATNDLMTQVKKLHVALRHLHLKHKALARELLRHCDMDAKNKAELKRVKGELKSTVAELEETNSKLAALKTERDLTKGTFFPVLNVGSKHVSVDRVRDKQNELQDMESTLKEIMDQASSQLMELKGLYDERIRIMQQLPELQNMLKNLKCISSSQAYLSLKNRMEKLKSEVVQYQALYEKLQVEKDNLTWREKELNIKNDLIDVNHRTSAIAESKMSDLRIELQKRVAERETFGTKLEEASRQTGRKEIIAEFKALVSSFPKEMSTMQSQLSKYKEAASNVHSLRADVQSLSNIIDRKVKECEKMSTRSYDQLCEIQRLQSVVKDLRESDSELKLIWEMYRLESTDSREVIEARDIECKAWANVQMLKSSLDENTLESRVKMAIEAEAISQQRLAAAEAEIADLRQKLETSKRDISRLSDVLKSKDEENEAYLSEIETIGQAYDDMQTQNQHLLKQITERDDYNIKLVIEGVRTRQMQDALLMEKHSIEKDIQRENASLDFNSMKTMRIEDQLKTWSEQLKNLAEDRHRNSATLENLRRRLSEVGRSSQQVRISLEESQSSVNQGRVDFMELQMELERERFEKKRMEEDMEGIRRKNLCIKAETEGSSVVQKLRQELREYREVLKCSICHDRLKEVVITKCYHLFCNPCIQKLIETRRRKCPVCYTSFGPNDVKPVYM